MTLRPDPEVGEVIHSFLCYAVVPVCFLLLLLLQQQNSANLSTNNCGRFVVSKIMTKKLQTWHDFIINCMKNTKKKKKFSYIHRLPYSSQVSKANFFPCSHAVPCEPIRLEMAWAAKKSANESFTGRFTGPLTAQFYLLFLIGSLTSRYQFLKSLLTFIF